MAIEETFRHEFQTRVEEALDAESARFLMAHLPPVPWPEVATKGDLANLETSIDARFANQETSIDARFTVSEERMARHLDGLKADFDQRFLTLHSQLTSGRADQSADLANQRADLTLLISNQTRTMIIALITAFVAISSLALFR